MYISARFLIIWLQAEAQARLSQQPEGHIFAGKQQHSDFHEIQEGRYIALKFSA